MGFSDGDVDGLLLGDADGLSDGAADTTTEQICSVCDRPEPDGTARPDGQSTQLPSWAVVPGAKRLL